MHYDLEKYKVMEHRSSVSELHSPGTRSSGSGLVYKTQTHEHTGSSKLDGSSGPTTEDSYFSNQGAAESTQDSAPEHGISCEQQDEVRNSKVDPPSQQRSPTGTPSSNNNDPIRCLLNPFSTRTFHIRHGPFMDLENFPKS